MTGAEQSDKDEGSSAAAAAPIAPVQASPAAIAAAIIEWDRRGRLVDDESYVQNSAPVVARSFHELLPELKSMTLLFRSALLCTSAEIAREARPFLDRADAVIKRAGG
jgi:hypothetical protein